MDGGLLDKQSGTNRVASDGCSLAGVETKESKRKQKMKMGLVHDDKAELKKGYKEQNVPSSQERFYPA